MAEQEAEQAYTYAWWLTGEDAAAEAAVHQAICNLGSPAGEPLPRLLADIRAAAIPARTMCPASEVALLHDAQGLALDEAAGIAVVDPADARTELAHGRLEALSETVSAPFEHPERLGGLAVGNPPDVAHARQCPSCAQAADLVSRGREELRCLPRPAVPDSLMELLAPGEPETAEQEPARRRWGLVAPAGLLLLALAGTAWLLTALSAREPAAPSEEIVEPSPAPRTVLSGPVRVVEPDAAAEPDDGLFRVSEADLVDTEGQPIVEGVLPPDGPLRLAVRYEGASAGVLLGARWSVDGEPYRDLRVVLSGRRSTHVFGGEPPEDGWPPGGHEIVLHVEGEVVAASHFTVAG